MVIPASAGIQGEEWAPPVFIPWGAGASRHERLVRNHVPLSEQGGPAPATPARISYRGDSRIAPGGVVIPNHPERIQIALSFWERVGVRAGRRQ